MELTTPRRRGGAKGVPPLAQPQIDAIYAAAQAIGLATNQAIAAHTGINRSYLSDILNRRTGPGMTAATKLSKGLGIPIAALAPTDSNQSTTESPSGLDANGRVVGQSRGHPFDYVELAERRRGRRGPVYEWGTCGQPNGAGTAEAVPVEWRDYPDGEDAVRKLGERGFAVRIKGQSMLNWDFEPGDLVWVNAERGYGAAINEPVLAQVLDETGADLGMVVKVLRQRNGELYLQSDGEGPDEVIPAVRFRYLGSVVLHQPREREPLRRSAAERSYQAPTDAVRYLGDGDAEATARRAG